MPYFDLDRAALRAYDPQPAEPPDARAFWTEQVEVTRSRPLEATFEPVDTGLRVIQTFDVRFTGADGDRVAAWLHLPVAGRGVDDGRALPAVVQYQGYGGGRGLAQEDVFWATAGYAQLVMDTRGQGSGWSVGSTPDPAGSPPAQPGFVTKGIADRTTYYYRRLFLDAVRAVDTVRDHPLVDSAQVAVTGVSQGGATALAAGSLVTDVVAVLPDVPFLCDVRRAVDIAQEEPFLELVRYLAAHRELVDATFATLAYFDLAVLGRWAKAPALFSVALMDRICPPSTVYAAYNAYGGAAKQIREYPFNDHEGGEIFQRVEQLRWLNALLDRSS